MAGLMQKSLAVPVVCLVQFRAKWVNAYEVAAVEPNNVILGATIVLRSGRSVTVQDESSSEVVAKLEAAMEEMVGPEPPDTSWTEPFETERQWRP